MTSSDNRDGDDAFPIDLDAIRADDALVDALSRDQLPRDWEPGDGDEALAALIAGWRHGIDADPMPSQPTLDDVEAEMATAARRRRTGGRLRLVGAAAAVLVVAFGAVSLAARDAEPGEALWSVKEAMYGSAASATIASASVQSNLEKAEQALSTGDTSRAAQYLADAQSKVPDMARNDARQRMADWAQRLSSQVAPAVPSPSSSPAPQTTGPDTPTVPVPTNQLVIPSIPTITVPDPRTLLTVPTPRRPNPPKSSSATPSTTAVPTTTAPAG